MEREKMTPLGKFVYDEMNSREMGAEEFAGQVGVSVMAIYRMLKGSTPRMPTLVKLASFTQYDIATVTSLLAPQTKRAISARAQIMSEKIQKLSPEKQEEIDAIINVMLSKQKQSLQGGKVRRRKF